MARMLMDCGKRVEPEARAYMEEVIGSWETISRPFLQTECDKIVLMAGNRTGISKKLLECALPEYMDQGIFKFTDALIAKMRLPLWRIPIMCLRTCRKQLKSGIYFR